MRARTAFCLLLLVLFSSSTVLARKTKRDAFLDPPKEGNFLKFDIFTLGTQLTLENVTDLEPGMSRIQTRVSGMFNFPYSQIEGAVDISVFLFSIGGTVGFKEEYRTLVPDPVTAPNTREFRRQADADGDYTSASIPYAEGRGRFVIPLDDFIMLNTAFWRYEWNRPVNSFDWFNAIPHNEGLTFKYDATLFYRHPDLGALGPTFRYIQVPASNGPELITRRVYAAGFLGGLSPGWISGGGTSDLAILQVLFAPFGKKDVQDLYGQQLYQAPMFLLLIYRAVMDL